MRREDPPSNSARWLKLAVVLVFVGGIGAFFALGAHEWLSLDTLKEHRNALLNFSRQHYWTALTAAILIYAAAVAFSVPGGIIMSLAVGMLFGRWTGTLVILIAATFGATLVFLGARYLFADAARRRLGGRAAKLIAGFNENAFYYLLFLRLVPLFPFWLVNLVPAFTAIPLRVYVAATALGIIPGSFVFANLGQSLGRINSTRELLSAEMLAAFALLGVFSLLPVMVKKIRGKDTPDSARAEE
ncbi:MAG: TVP38/TMEM64 family protein [Pseudomonadota bacterium]